MIRLRLAILEAQLVGWACLGLVLSLILVGLLLIPGTRPLYDWLEHWIDWLMLRVRALEDRMKKAKSEGQETVIEPKMTEAVIIVCVDEVGRYAASGWHYKDEPLSPADLESMRNVAMESLDSPSSQIRHFRVHVMLPIPKETEVKAGITVFEEGDGSSSKRKGRHAKKQ